MQCHLRCRFDQNLGAFLPLIIPIPNLAGAADLKETHYIGLPPKPQESLAPACSLQFAVHPIHTVQVPLPRRFEATHTHCLMKPRGGPLVIHATLSVALALTADREPSCCNLNGIQPPRHSSRHRQGPLRAWPTQPSMAAIGSCCQQPAVPPIHWSSLSHTRSPPHSCYPTSGNGLGKEQGWRTVALT